MKSLTLSLALVSALLMILLGSVLTATAQMPVATASCNPPVAGCLLATAYPGQQPTPWYVPVAPVAWTPWPTMPPPPVYPSPTSTTWNWFAARAINYAVVYTCPSTVCYNIGRLLPGEVVTVRPASPGWLQIESGYLIGQYVQAGDVVRV